MMTGYNFLESGFKMLTKRWERLEMLSYGKMSRPIEWRIRFKLATSTYKACTLAIHLTLLIFCNIINPQCPRALLPVSYLQFHSIHKSFILWFSFFSCLDTGNLKLLKFVNVKLWLHSQSLKDPLLLVSLFCRLASIILCALILSETLAPLLTYLSTYLLTFGLSENCRKDFFMSL